LAVCVGYETEMNMSSNPFQCTGAVYVTDAVCRKAIICASVPEMLQVGNIQTIIEGGEKKSRR
jgi:hypothetical protein